MSSEDLVIDIENVSKVFNILRSLLIDCCRCCCHGWGVFCLLVARGLRVNVGVSSGRCVMSV